METTDTLVIDGGEIKSLGNGKFGGYLVLFGSPEKTDLVRDYFTPDTDFGLGFDGGAKSVAVPCPIYFDHCKDPVLKRACIGEGMLTKDAKGIWMEGQLKARKEYSDAVKEIIGKDIPALIEGKKLGLSSGTAPHLVERKQVGNAFEIKSWPLGLDASLTAGPCEPRTQAVPLKSWLPSAAKGVHLGPMAAPAAAMAAVRTLHDRLHGATWEHLGDEKSAPAARMKKIAAAYDECKATSLKCMKSLMGDDPEEGGDEGTKSAPPAALEAARVLLEAELATLLA